MSKTKESEWKITGRFASHLKSKVEKEAKKKRWSVNTFIEEAIIEKLGI